VANAALLELERAFRDDRFNGFGTDIHVVHPEHGLDGDFLNQDVFLEEKALLTSGKQLTDHPALLDEVLLMFKHLSTSQWKSEFIACRERDCTLCSHSRPVTPFEQFRDKFGGTMPSPLDFFGFGANPKLPTSRPGKWNASDFLSSSVSAAPVPVPEIKSKSKRTDVVAKYGFMNRKYRCFSDLLHCSLPVQCFVKNGDACYRGNRVRYMCRECHFQHTFQSVAALKRHKTLLYDSVGVHDLQ
jgi:hypothetical protein